jgi:hypothetical protein
LGCAIFGITEVPTDGVEFDSGDQETGHGGWNGSQSEPPVIPVPPASQPAPSQSSTNQYNPPAQGSSEGWDSEKGDMRKSFIETPAENKGTQRPAAVIPDSTNGVQTQETQQTNSPVDLLDSGAAPVPKKDANGASFDLD